MKGIFAEARSRRLPELGGVRRVIEGEIDILNLTQQL